MERVLIVGNGYAGVQAARTLAQEKALSVTMVSAEDCPAYVPHLLPELAAGKMEAGDLFLPRGSEHEAMGLRFRPGARVKKLFARKRIALLSNEETVAFDKALVAAGASPWIPENLKPLLEQCGNVLALKRLADAIALRKFLDGGATNIVIIGAGRVGMLLAEALKDRGAAVAIVEIGTRILATMLQQDVAERLQPVLAERRHLKIHTGTQIARFGIDGGKVRKVQLADGATLPCDVVVIATGVVPNTGFMEDTRPAAGGLAVGNRMETAEPGIYAAGDVVFFETVTGRKEPGQLVVNARTQAEVAARNIAGHNVPCPPMFTGNVVKLDPVIAARIGDIDGTDHADFTVHRDFVRATLNGSTVTGLQMIGDPESLRGLVPAVLKKFRPEDLDDLFRGRSDLGLAPLLLSRGYAWA
ncbi:MAG TPA: FAD-dependent oxidoreductase [Candidatus Deferrimicrobiaceae bacterium]|nr:FAD-dependent oxidoreductase [Candidatus Deferrimicrobiaceae bacterium]